MLMTRCFEFSYKDMHPMCHDDDYRYAAHRHLIDLEASICQVMMLVASGKVSGVSWDAALMKQRQLFDSWLEFSESPAHSNEEALVCPLPAVSRRE